MCSKKPFQRLPNCVKPKHYILEIEPDLEALSFTGNVQIEVLIFQPTKEITLHSCDLEIAKAKFVHEADCEVNCCRNESIKYDEANQTVSLQFCDQELPKGSGTLHIEFIGTINDYLHGFYKSRYLSATDGSDRVSAVTHFRPNCARKCFPCFDEPALKATFDLILIVSEDLVGLSNMPIKSERKENEKRIIQYEKTPEMSTYLVAFVVGEYDFVEDKTKSGVVVKVYTPVGEKEQGRFALQAALKVLPFYEQYFGMKYPLPKLDLIAISEFDAGALGNWGLVMFKEGHLLLDKDFSMVGARQMIVIFVAHELVHQWFGNLVTIEWWTYLWLHESFASFMEHLCCEHIFGDFYTPTQFFVDVLNPALDLDARSDSRPIETKIENPVEIYRTYSYNKGACLIRMLYSYLGDDCFRKGVYLYLTRHRYGNATSDDFWACLEEVSGKSVGPMMKCWAHNPGFPLIIVSEKQSENNRVLNLSQERFLSDGTKANNATPWIVPLSFLVSSCTCQSSSSALLETNTLSITLAGVSSDCWIKINPGSTGFYRVMYCEKMIAAFGNAILYVTMPVMDRMSVLSDMYAISKSGRQSLRRILELMPLYRYETNCMAWDYINDCLTELTQFISNTDLMKPFTEYAIDLFSTIRDQVRWDPEPEEEIFRKSLRYIVLSRLLMLGDAGVIEEAKKRFKEHVCGKKLLNPDLSSLSYAAVMMDGEECAMDQLIMMYLYQDLPQVEKLRILIALGKTKNPALISKILKLILSDLVCPQDVLFPLYSVVRSCKGRNLAWKFFKANRAQLLNKCRSAGLVGQLISLLTSSFSCRTKAREVSEYFRREPISEAEAEMKEAIRTIKTNARWLDRNYQDIADFLISLNKC